MDFDEETDDVYDNEDYWDTFQDNNVFSHYGIWDLWEDCLVPSVLDGFSASKVLIICCLLARITITLGKPPPALSHLILLLSGLIGLYSFFQGLLLYVVALALIGLASIFVTHYARGRQRGLFCGVVCIVFVILCELFIVEKTKWHKIRGSQMVLCMKLISLAVDIDSGKSHLPTVTESLGYCFCIGTVIFGPWVSFTDYLVILEDPTLSLMRIWHTVSSFLLSLFFLSISSCWSQWLLPSGDWSCRWVEAYRDALSFRTSHYFISYLSQSTSALVGLPTSKVASPVYIEFPRSLVEVVIYWNMPMHRWLKNYIFKTTKMFGTFSAIILTYSASSLLHGLNFQLAAVLLSLGFYTYIEFVLRQKLSSIFDACIESRSCSKECRHQYKYSHPCVLVTNVAFGFLAVFHLAYLGLMFDSSSNIEDEGYSMSHTISKWSHLSFTSHWIALGTYLFYLVAT